MNLKGRVEKLEGAAGPQDLEFFCLFATCDGQDEETAQEGARAAYVAKHGREPDDYIVLVPLTGKTDGGQQ